MHGVLILLSVVGLYISLYFSLVYYGLMGTRNWLVPAFCRMEEDACQLVVHHSDARVLGVPNSVIGVGYYLLVILVGVEIGSSALVSSIRIMSWVSVVLGVYLGYSLFFRIRAFCPLCVISHSVNLMIALMLTLWW